MTLIISIRNNECLSNRKLFRNKLLIITPRKLQAFLSLYESHFFNATILTYMMKYFPLASGMDMRPVLKV